jgi:hypothetical protein
MTRRSERDTANFSIARDLEGEVNPACRQALNSVGFRRATNFLHNSTPHKNNNKPPGREIALTSHGHL